MRTTLELAAGLLVVVPLCEHAGQSAPPKKQQSIIRIAKDTTHLTRPLDAEGFLDYVEVVNQRAKRGVKPESNFDVVVQSTRGPAFPEIPRMRRAYFRRLGVASPPRNGDYFAIDEFLYSRNLRDKIDRALDGPWKAQENVPVRDWLKSADKHLDQLATGARRPHNYTPYIRSEGSDRGEFPWLVTVLLPSTQAQRNFARGFVMRAHLRIGEGQFHAAWKDLQTIRHLARHAASGITTIERLVGLTCETMSFLTERRVLIAGSVSPDLLRTALRDLLKLSSLPSLEDQFDFGSRLLALDAVQWLAKHSTTHEGTDLLKVIRLLSILDDVADANDEPSEAARVVFVSFQETPQEQSLIANVDWNAALKTVNAWYDRAATAAQEVHPAKRHQFFAVFESDLQQVRRKIGSKNLRLPDGDGDPAAIGQQIGNLVATLLLADAHRLNSAMDMAQARRDVIVVAFATQLHFREKDRYPRALDELVPRYLSSIPVDAMTGRPLRYRTSAKETAIYSVGRNLQEDAGKGLADRGNNNRKSDDIAVWLKQADGN